MTIKELITALKEYNKDMEVHIGTPDYVAVLEPHNMKLDSLVQEDDGAVIILVLECG